MDLFYSKPFRIEVLVSITQDRIKSGRDASPQSATSAVAPIAADRAAPQAESKSAAALSRERIETIPEASALTMSASPPAGAGAALSDGSSASDVLSVLIVEDSLPIMKAMSMNLRRAKHTVEQAVNGLIGLECMKQKEFDVVVMDLQVCVSVDGDGGG